MPSQIVFESIIRPNPAMGARQLAVFVICFAVLSLTIALSFFSMGLWLVLPFAGLEVLIVGTAIGYSLRRAEGSEHIVVTDETVSVVQRQFGQTRRLELQRYWAQVRWEAGPSRLQPGRLLLGSHGRFIEIARELVDEERRRFGERLKEAIRGGGNRFYRSSV